MGIKAAINEKDYEGEQTWMESFNMYYLGGEKPEIIDTVDVYIEQASRDTHFAQLTFVQGCTTYHLLNFNPKGMRKLARFLLDTAVSLEAAGGEEL